MWFCQGSLAQSPIDGCEVGSSLLWSQTRCVDYPRALCATLRPAPRYVNSAITLAPVSPFWGLRDKRRRHRTSPGLACRMACAVAREGTDSSFVPGAPGSWQCPDVVCREEARAMKFPTFPPGRPRDLRSSALRHVGHCFGTHGVCLPPGGGMTIEREPEMWSGRLTLVLTSWHLRLGVPSLCVLF